MSNEPDGLKRLMKLLGVNDGPSPEELERLANETNETLEREYGPRPKGQSRVFSDMLVPHLGPPTGQVFGDYSIQRIAAAAIFCLADPFDDYEYAVDEGVTNFPPMMSLRGAKTGKSQQRIVGDSLRAAFVAAIEEYGGEEKYMRDVKEEHAHDCDCGVIASLAQLDRAVTLLRKAGEDFREKLNEKYGTRSTVKAADNAYNNDGGPAGLERFVQDMTDMLRISVIAACEERPRITGKPADSNPEPNEKVEADAALIPSDILEKLYRTFN